MVSSLVHPQHLPWESWFFLDLESQNQNLIFPSSCLAIALSVQSRYVYNHFIFPRSKQLVFKGLYYASAFFFTAKWSQFHKLCRSSYKHCPGWNRPSFPTNYLLWPHGVVHRMLLPIFHWGHCNCKPGEIPTNPSWPVTFLNNNNKIIAIKGLAFFRTPGV